MARSEKSVEQSQACIFIEMPRTPGMWILGGNKANVAKQYKKQFSHRRHPINHYRSLRPTGQASSRPLLPPPPPRHVPTDRVSTPLSLHVNYLHLTRTLSTHPQLSFNLRYFTCQRKFQPLRRHMSTCYCPADYKPQQLIIKQIARPVTVLSLSSNRHPQSSIYSLQAWPVLCKTKRNPKET